MGSQFVDFNADGHLDYLSATFDGSPHVAYGSEKGFAQPVRLLDRNGERILISSIWDYDAKQHVNLGRSMPDGKERHERCISALAFDWDGDGDYDLLLGSYENGHLYRQMNEGTNKDPKFTGKNVAVLAGEKPFALPAKMTAPRLVDWDGDGDLDIVAGTFGDSYSPQGIGGGVYLARNVGAKGAPRFAALETLIEPQPKGGAEPTKPDAGLYPEVVDWDGDGDLDLVVGGYSMWQPPQPALTDEQKAEAARLETERAGAQKELSDLMAAIQKETAEAAGDIERSSPEYREVWQKIFKLHNAEYNDARAKVQKLAAEHAKLVPPAKREAFVWLYERQ